MSPTAPTIATDNCDNCAEIDIPPDPAVLATLEMYGPNENPKPVGSLLNVQRVLEGDALYVGRFRFNELANAVYVSPPPGVDGAPAPIRDEDETRFALEIHRRYELRSSPKGVGDVIRFAARGHSFHPIREYLDRLVWDGRPRCSRLLPRYFGAADTDLNAKLGRCFLLAAVARVYAPGCKVDNVLILVGEQGAKKSTGLRCLAVNDAWFSDSIIAIGSKDAYQSLLGKWIIEFAELDSIARKDESTIKAFLTSTSDHYRPSYGRNDVDLPRRCVFVGSTNKPEFLSDPTGSRRFWPVRAGRVDLDAILADRDHLWAEAARAYRGGERWWLDTEGEAALSEASEEYRTEHPWEPTIAAWASKRIVPFTISDVLTEAVERDVSQQTQQDEKTVAAILRHLGFEKSRRQTGGNRCTVWERR